MTSSPLILRAKATITFEADIDVVTYFASQGRSVRKIYFGLDLAEWGCSSEYERPLALLMSQLGDDLLGFGPQGQGVSETPASGEPDWDGGPEVLTRGGERVFGRDRWWTEDDYEQLLAAVPWMRPEAEAEITVHPGQGVLPI